MIGRREFIAGLGAAGAGCGRVWAQASDRPIMLAFLSIAEDDSRDAFHSFRARLKELGWIEGHNLALKFFLSGGAERIGSLAAAVARSDAGVVLADGTDATRAMAKASRVIPIISITGSDPTGAGLSASFARPSANITGISIGQRAELDLKRFEVLRDLVPSVRRIGVAYSPGRESVSRTLIDAGEALGLEMRRLVVDSAPAAMRVLAPEALSDLDAVLVISDALLDSMAQRLVGLINAAGKPAVYPEQAYARGGGLMSYGTDMEDVFRRLAEFVDQALRGKKPSEMPFEQYHRIKLVINLRTARALKIAIPEPLFARADEVIE